MPLHLPPTILIVDPNSVSRTHTSNALERAGFNVITAMLSGPVKKLHEFINAQKPSLIIIHNALSPLTGIELCTILRTKDVKTQIILIAHKEDSIESLKGTPNAFEEYLIIPFSPANLVYKVKTLLGKVKPNLQSTIIEFKDVRMNLASYKVMRAGRDIHLGPTEFKLLQCFVENPSEIFSRDHLIEYIRENGKTVEKRTIDVHINRLRTALKLPSEHVPIIKTVRCAGYCLNLPENITANT